MLKGRRGGGNGVTRCSRCRHILSTISAPIKLILFSFFLSVCLRASTQVAIPPFTPRPRRSISATSVLLLEILISCFICRLSSAVNKKKKKNPLPPLCARACVCRSHSETARRRRRDQVIGGRRGRSTPPNSSPTFGSRRLFHRRVLTRSDPRSGVMDLFELDDCMIALELCFLRWKKNDQSSPDFNRVYCTVCRRVMTGSAGPCCGPR